MWDRVGAKVRFCPLASGSSGNCTLISTEYTNILVDAGLTGKKIEAALGELGLNGKDIDAIFITHEHKDHIKVQGYFPEGIKFLSMQLREPGME